MRVGRVADRVDVVARLEAPLDRDRGDAHHRLGVAVTEQGRAAQQQDLLDLRQRAQLGGLGSAARSATIASSASTQTSSLLSDGTRRSSSPPWRTKSSRGAQGELLERLQAVGDERGRQHRQPLHAGAGELDHAHVGERLDPGVAAESRLKRHLPTTLGEPEPLRDAAGGREALGAIAEAVGWADASAAAVAQAVAAAGRGRSS